MLKAVGKTVSATGGIVSDMASDVDIGGIGSALDEALEEALD